MYKNYTQDLYCLFFRPFKYWIMRITFTAMILLITCMHISASSWAQRITLKKRDITLREVFKDINKQTGYQFMWSAKKVKNTTLVSVDVVQQPLEIVLKQVLSSLPLSYELEGKMILIKEKKEESKTDSPKNSDDVGGLQELVEVRGKVVDSVGLPLPGVSVRTIPTQKYPKSIQTTTDQKGVFLLRNVPEELNIEFVSVGFRRQTRGVMTNLGTVIMISDNKELKEVAVVSSGIMTRRKESFTGSAVTITRDELLRAGNQNLLQSLKNVDPSFQIIENLSMGSNPNGLPEIQMRGQNSLPNLQGDFSGNPNQPLFILDGFETTLQRVYDLNMNRVASVTLLKDAAAKAIYGSRAANGVVVIETRRPVSGELRISYTGDLSIETPDLNGYNMMNAREKLDFERERGMYSRYINDAAAAQRMDAIYKQNLDNVIQGVDTYWLSQPLRTGVGNKHAINLEGGDERMRYLAGVTYNNVAGVMKGSGRTTMGINTTLSYTYKNLIFRNSLEYNRNVADNSPYGSFSEYIGLNQYYKPYDENGNAVKILGENRLGNVYNPLYNASLNTKSETGYSEVINNFNVDWRINRALRATGSISYSRNESSSDVFFPASHTMFINYDANGLSERKGRYTKGNGTSQFVNSNIGLNYNKTLGRHLLFANATWNLSSRRDASSIFVAEGFGNDNMDNISFASQYEFNGKPVGADSRIRELGLVGVLNYSFADRYLFDASLRTSGSSMYGADNRWGAFWSLGAGWNLHREKFMEKIDWLEQLKIRSSLGYTGSQNFDPFQSRARYLYGDIVYNGRLGAQLMGLPNSSLKWQRTKDFNAGMDMAIKRVLNVRFDYYLSTTTDLLSDLTIVPSMGFSSYKDNFGASENEGFEFAVGITPWRNTAKRGWFTVNVSALHNKNRLKNIYDIFTSWNQKQDEVKNQVSTAENYNTQALKEAYTRPSTYFIEGQSMTAIRGVRSLGIDPVTGQEMYLDRNGNSTWIWNTADQTIIGDSSPKLRGNIGFNMGYNGFTMALTCSYKFGGDLYNTTLVDRLENVTGYDNLDRRILQSWRNEGDLAPYRALTIAAGTTEVYTKPTSRFVQRDNELYISSLNLGYDFIDRSWMKRMKLDRLRCSFYMNELLRVSSVTIERGTSYPFARNFSLMFQATF